MLKKILATGLSIILATQSAGLGAYALEGVPAITSSNEVVVQTVSSQLTNMEAMKILVNYFGVDYFTQSSDENLADNKTKEKIHAMLSEPTNYMSNYEMVNLLADLVDVKERQMIENGDEEQSSNVNLNSNLMTFFELGYLSNAQDFKPSSSANIEDMQSVLDNMLGYVVKSTEDLNRIPEDVKRITIIDSSVSVKDMTINADVFVTPRAKQGVTFKNTQIKGSLEVAGGTETTPVVLEDSEVEHLVLSQSAFETGVSICGESNVKSIKTKMSSKVVCEDKTTIESIETQANTKVVVGAGVKVDKMTTGSSTELETEKGAKISTLVAKAETKISGTDVVDKLEKESNEVNVEDKSKKAAVTPSESTGGSSSGGGGGGGGGGSSKKKSSSDKDDSKDSDDNKNSGDDGSGEDNTPSEEWRKGPSTPIENVDSYWTYANSIVVVDFSKEYGAIDKNTAESLKNYYIEGFGNPTKAVLSGHQVFLRYSRFLKGKKYTLEVFNVGNASNYLSVDVVEHFRGSNAVFSKFYNVDIADPSKGPAADIESVRGYRDGEETVVLLEFVDQYGAIDKESAESLNNYYVFGYGNPKSAKLYDYTVVLRFDLIDCAQRLYVYNVKNEKNNYDDDYDKSYYTGNTPYKETFPSVKKVAQSDQGYLAITFDESISYSSDSYIKYQFNGSPNETGTLKPVKRVGENKEILIFDIRGIGNVGDALKITEIHNILDALENPVVDFTEQSIELKKVEYKPMEPVSYNQTEDTCIEVQFDFAVETISDKISVETSKGIAEFSILTEFDTLKLTCDPYTLNLIDDRKALEFDFSQAIVDVLNRPVSDEIYEVMWMRNRIDGIQVINGTTLKIVDDKPLPHGTYSVISGSAISGDIIGQFEYDGTIDVSSKYDGLRDVSKNTDSDANEILIVVNEQYVFIEDQTFAIKVDVNEDAMGMDFKENFDGHVEEIAPYKIDFEKGYIEFDYLEDNDDEYIKLYVNDELLDPSKYTHDDEDIYFSFKKGDRVRLLVFDKENDMIIRGSNVFTIH